MKKWIACMLALVLVLACLPVGTLAAGGVCAMCDGTGRCTSSSCNNGRCTYCNGTGKDECTKCHGSGLCVRCDGRGGWNEGLRWKKCYSCSGMGRCTRCSGMGGSRCIFCGATGDCRICFGKGYCPLCKGTGKLGGNGSGTSTQPTQPPQPTPTPVKTFTVTFSSNGGSGTMANQTATNTSRFTLPTCTFTPPAGQYFKAWSINGNQFPEGQPVTLWTDTTIQAVWQNLPSSGFRDVPDGVWFTQPVIWAVNNGITSGTGTNTFSPNQICTVAQILTLLAKAYDAPKPAIANPFSDVSLNSYYYDSVLWAYQQGIVSGSTLGPDQNCTRSMVVTYLWKAAGSPTPQSTASFTDVPSTAPYAQAVSWAVEQGITSGTSATAFSPDKTCTRAEIVMFLYRSLNGASR